MTILLALPALLVLWAIFQVPAQTSAWLRTARSQWQGQLERKPKPWVWVRYWAVVSGIRAVGLVSMAIGLHYVWLVARVAGWAR